MKHLLLPAALLLATVPALAQMQPPPPTSQELQQSGAELPQPFKGANVIIIHAPDSAATAYRKFASLLLGAGYTLDRTDKDLLFMSTKSRSAPRYNMMHSLSASMAPAPGGSIIRLKDAFSLPGAAAVMAAMAGESETQYRGGTSSTFMVCWAEMERVAALYPGAKITYAKRP